MIPVQVIRDFMLKIAVTLLFNGIETGMLGFQNGGTQFSVLSMLNWIWD
uniref:Uncharacterized protein n=1 Tax=Moniliophthora roreri TaxID=221103 RepID=A0A0W0FGS8_MONRR